MITLLKVLYLLLTTTLCAAVTRYNLGGQWTATGGDAGIIIDNATVPGGIFSDLMNAGEIGDVFAGTADTDYRWVGESDWTYTRTVTVDQVDYEVINLVFEGLDTFATVFVNDVEVGTSQNMFVRYVFDVTESLKLGDNEIRVQFVSAANKAKELGTDASNEYIIPPECPAEAYNGICYANRIRKMQAAFSWDWGPAFSSVGIWKEVYLEAYNYAVIDYVVATPLRNPDQSVWTVSIMVYFNNHVDAVLGNLTVTLQTEGEPVSETFSVEQYLNEYNEILINPVLEVSTDDVNTWWPNGYGTQDLYELTATFTAEDETSEKTIRIGFRTIELVQEELGQGLSFYFKVNDVPIFAKGANEIPINILPEKGQDEDTIIRLMQTVKDTHMNMLRVWGGGVYESDFFYDIADEYGILIWEDFMFACALYPSTPEFLSNVAEEIRHQLKRLGSHASIALWAGNNENEAALRDDWWGVRANFTLYQEDYVKLYIDTIQPEVNRILPHSIFVSSSPSNGLLTDEQGHVATNPSNPLYGDVHFYDYTSDSWDPATFPIARFSSEYGYQSYPSIESFLTATNSLEDLVPTSDFMTQRQHHPNGNNENLALIQKQLQLPDSSSENYAKAFIYFSQIVQARSYKTETEHHRSFKGRLNDAGQGNTMGALYWQLNDVWVAPTWSGLDFIGRWKLLQYQVKEFFNPLIITGRLSSDELEIYAVLDALEVPNITVKSLMHIYKWDSLNPLVAVEFPVTLDTTRAVLVTTVHAETALMNAGCGEDYSEAKKNCFFHLHLLDQDNNHLVPFNHVFPEKLKNCNLANANPKIESITPVDEAGKVFEIVVSTDVVALFVWLDSHEILGRFSENGFVHVLPNKTVSFMADEPTTVEELQNVLTITHLRDPAFL